MRITNNFGIADIHTHILPNMDDGARSSEEALQILLEEQRQGITDVVLTPHFNLANEKMSDFLSRREEAFGILSKEIKENGSNLSVNLYLGAEVRYDPSLVYCDVFNLCIQGTSYLLLELPNQYPFNFEQTIQWLLSKGVSPILAHIERYEYLITNRKLLEELLYSGVVFQCNASTLFSRFYSKRIKKLLKNGYVHLLASDTHGTEIRPPMLQQGLKKASKYSDWLIANSMNVVKDKLL